jgi:hypothetical protein
VRDSAHMQDRHAFDVDDFGTLSLSRHLLNLALPSSLGGRRDARPRASRVRNITFLNTLPQ